MFGLGKTHPKCWRKNKFAKKIKRYNRISPKWDQVISMNRGLMLPSFVVIGWVVLTLSCRQAIFLNQCPSPDFESRSRKAYPVHFSRPILPLPQICKVWHKWLWSERQKSLQQQWTWRRTRKRTKNIVTPDRGDLTPHRGHLYFYS